MDDKPIYKEIGPSITGIQKKWIDKIVALDIVPVKTIKEAIDKGTTGLKNLWTKVKKDNKTFGEEKTWIQQHRKKKRHSKSPTNSNAYGGSVKKYARGGGVRKPRTYG